MLFLYAPGDDKGKRASEFFFNEVLVANPKGGGGTLRKLDQTFLQPVAAAGSLRGAALLGNNAKLKTEDTMQKYLAAIQKERARIARKPRNYSAPYYVDLRAFGLQVP